MKIKAGQSKIKTMYTKISNVGFYKSQDFAKKEAERMNKSEKLEGDFSTYEIKEHQYLDGTKIYIIVCNIVRTQELQNKIDNLFND